MKKEDIASLVIYLIMIGAAIIVGLTAVQSVFQAHYHIKMVSYLFAIIVIVVGLLFNIIMLEVGHVIGAKLGHYKVISFNVLGFCWQKKDGKWLTQSGNVVPLQFTFVWACRDFCTAPGLTFSGFVDIWGQKMNLFDRKNNTYTDPTKQSFVFLSEPQLWYSIGQWFKCPNLCIGTEIEFSYNFGGKGFMCNPCVGLKWQFL